MDLVCEEPVTWEGFCGTWEDIFLDCLKQGQDSFSVGLVIEPVIYNSWLEYRLKMELKGHRGKVSVHILKQGEVIHYDHPANVSCNGGNSSMEKSMFWKDYVMESERTLVESGENIIAIAYEHMQDLARNQGKAIELTINKTSIERPTRNLDLRRSKPRYQFTA